MELFELLKTGSLDDIKTLIDTDPTLVKSKDDNKKTVVFYAIEQNNIELLNYLISKKASVKGSDKSKKNGLHYAVVANNPEIVKLLITKKVNVNQCEKDGRPPIDMITNETKPEIIKLLLDGGQSIDQRYKKRYRNPHSPDSREKKMLDRTPLIAAIIAQNSEAVKVMLQKEPEMDLILDQDNLWNQGMVDQYEFGYYPFYYGTLEIANQLIAAKMPLKIELKNKRLIIEELIRKNDLPLFKRFIETFNVDINTWVSAWERQTMLTRATEFDRIEFVQYLVENGANLTLRHESDHAPIHAAMKRGDINMIHYLLNNGADINQPGEYLNHPFTYLIKDGHTHLIPELVEQYPRVDLNYKKDLKYSHDSKLDFEFRDGGASLRGGKRSNFISTVIGNDEDQDQNITTIDYLISKGVTLSNDHIVSALFKGGKFKLLTYLIQQGENLNLLYRNEKGEQSILDVILLRTSHHTTLLQTAIDHNPLVLQYLKLIDHKIYQTLKKDDDPHFNCPTDQRMISIIPKNATTFVFEIAGKKYSEFPKMKQDEDQDRYNRVKAFFKDIKRGFKERVDTYKEELKRKLCDNTTYSVDQWEMIYLKNPVMKEVAASVVWGSYHDQKLNQIFLYQEDGSLQDIEYEAITVDHKNMIKPVHPLELTKEQMTQINTILEDFELVQVVPQININTFKPKNNHISNITDFMDHPVKSSLFRNRLYKAQWQYGTVKDHGIFYDYSKIFNYFLNNKPQEVTVTINYSGDHIRAKKSTVKEILVKDIVFSKTFKELPPVVYSEIIREVTGLLK